VVGSWAEGHKNNIEGPGFYTRQTWFELCVWS
jgi:hypothetical protein